MSLARFSNISRFTVTTRLTLTGIPLVRPHHQQSGSPMAQYIAQHSLKLDMIPSIHDRWLLRHRIHPNLTVHRTEIHHQLTCSQIGSMLLTLYVVNRPHHRLPRMPPTTPPTTKTMTMIIRILKGTKLDNGFRRYPCRNAHTVLVPFSKKTLLARFQRVSAQGRHYYLSASHLRPDVLCLLLPLQIWSSQMNPAQPQRRL